MRYFIIAILMIVFIGNASAFEPGIHPGDKETISQDVVLLRCILTCDGQTEDEPPLVDDYVDEFNSGCGYHGSGDGFQHLTGDQNGELVFCGKSGWFEEMGADGWDTDWTTVVVGPTGQIEWTLDAEQETYGYLLGPNDCNEVGVLQTMTVGPCSPGTMILSGEPGDVLWLWVAPTAFTPPPDQFGNEYDYVSNFSGLVAETVATEIFSFDRMKSIYR